VEFESKIDPPIADGALRAIQDWPLAIVFDRSTQISVNGVLKMQVSLIHSVANRRKNAYNESFEDKGHEFERHFGVKVSVCVLK
jgi:hypothetical protein